MKLQVLVSAVVYKTKANVMKDRDTGREINWYQVVLDQNEDVDTFTCTEDVFLKAPRFAECTLVGEYDSGNKRFKFVDIVDAPATAETPATSDAPATAEIPATSDAPETGKKSRK